MATVQRFEGPSLDDVLAQVRLALGDDAEIIEANRIKASGVIGSDRYEVKARRAQRGQRRADRQAADAHVNPMSGAGAGRGEAYPGGLDDATVQAAMDHVQQVMADLERKRIAEDHADTPSPTSLVDLADQVIDDSPTPAFGRPNLGDDPSFAALLAEARANAKANAPKIPMEWPELDAMSGAEVLADTGTDDGTVEWEPLDWSARRVRTTDPEPMSPPTTIDLDKVDEYTEGEDDFGPALVGSGFGAGDLAEADEAFTSGLASGDADFSDGDDSVAATDATNSGFTDDMLADDSQHSGDLTPGEPGADDGDSVAETDGEAPASLATTLFGDEAQADHNLTNAPDPAEGPAPVEDSDPVEDSAPAEDSAPVEDSDSIDPPELADSPELAEGLEPVEEPVSQAPTEAETEDTDAVAEAQAEPMDGAHHRELPETEATSAAMALAEPVEPASQRSDEAELAPPTDEVDESTQTGWVDADREFMGVWTDEAEHDEAGWFATGEPDDEMQAFATLRNHRLVEWLSRNDLTPEALNQALEGLPRPDNLPPGPGVIIAVVGEGPLVLPLARRIAVDLEADPAKVVLASEHRSHASVPDNCRISSADEAALDRRAWRRRSSATLVAVDTSTSLAANAQDWACQVLESLQPHQVIALVDAGRKAEDVARWIADLGGIDAIALTGLEETVSPHAILELGIPVARLGTQVATPRAWSALLRNRREPVE